MSKALLTFSIDTGMRDAQNPSGRADIKLYSEGGALVWRAAGEHGDEIDMGRQPQNLEMAKADARRAYSAPSWKMQASWL